MLQSNKWVFLHSCHWIMNGSNFLKLKIVQILNSVPDIRPDRIKSSVGPDIVKCTLLFKRKKKWCITNSRCLFDNVFYQYPAYIIKQSYLKANDLCSFSKMREICTNHLKSNNYEACTAVARCFPISLVVMVLVN